jgi:phage shock protein PspC (stress-responsive transcriptional regulator)
VPDVLAALRPNSLDLPLFMHVIGAMVLVGALVAALSAQRLATSAADGTDGILRRFAFRALLFAALPAYVVMRIAAQSIHDRELGKNANDPTWVGIGFIVSDAGAIFLIATIILAWRATKKEGASGLARAALILTGVMLVAYLVAMWAMTAKPGS